MVVAGARLLKLIYKRRRRRSTHYSWIAFRLPHDLISIWMHTHNAAFLFCELARGRAPLCCISIAWIVLHVRDIFCIYYGMKDATYSFHRARIRNERQWLWHARINACKRMEIKHSSPAGKFWVELDGATTWNSERKNDVNFSADWRCRWMRIWAHWGLCWHYSYQFFPFRFNQARHLRNLIGKIVLQNVIDVCVHTQDPRNVFPWSILAALFSVSFFLLLFLVCPMP